MSENPLRNLRKRFVSAFLRVGMIISDEIFASQLDSSAERFANGLGLPPYFIHQLLAVEDKRFAYHPGLDVVSIMRALVFNLASTGSPHGASTITQQIYSNSARISGTYQQTVPFKVAQLTWAVHETLRHSKEAVLSQYLDSVYFGRSYYGLQQAAYGYCRRVPKDLTVAESFFLVERIATPNRINTARVAMLATRKAIAGHIGQPEVIHELAVLYERHFGCGEVMAKCLEKSLKKKAARTSTFFLAASNEQ